MIDTQLMVIYDILVLVTVPFSIIALAQGRVMWSLIKRNLYEAEELRAEIIDTLALNRVLEKTGLDYYSFRELTNEKAITGDF